MEKLEEDIENLKELRKRKRKDEKAFRDLGPEFGGLLAQLVERMTLNHHVVGSIPTQSTP